MTKLKEKKEAIRLRKQGYSYSLIKDKLNVSKSTLSQWLSGISYKPNREVLERISNSLESVIGYQKNKKQKSIIEALKLAEKDIGRITDRDLFMLGIALYIGEGGKTGGLIRIVNSDPDIIRLAIKWFKKCCGVKNENFTLRVYLYPDNNVKRSLQFWSKATGIPISQFQKTQIDVRKNKKISKRGKLPHGTAHLNVRSCGNKKHGVFLSRRIHGWMDIIYDQC